MTSCRTEYLSGRIPWAIKTKNLRIIWSRLRMLDGRFLRIEEIIIFNFEHQNLIQNIMMVKHNSILFLVCNDIGYSEQFATICWTTSQGSFWATAKNEIPVAAAQRGRSAETHSTNADPSQVHSIAHFMITEWIKILSVVVLLLIHVSFSQDTGGCGITIAAIKICV